GRGEVCAALSAEGRRALSARARSLHTMIRQLFRPGVRLLALALTLVTILAGPAAAQPASPARPPNIVVVFADDLGYGGVGCFGAKGYATPNIDRLAAEGIRFTDFYVAQAVCSASRTALLTGCYPNRVGILGALGPKSKIGIADSEL